MIIYKGKFFKRYDAIIFIDNAKIDSREMLRNFVSGTVIILHGSLLILRNLLLFISQFTNFNLKIVKIKEWLTEKKFLFAWQVGKIFERTGKKRFSFSKIALS